MAYQSPAPLDIARHDAWLARRDARLARRDAWLARRDAARDEAADDFVVAGLCALAFAFILATVRTLSGV